MTFIFNATNVKTTSYVKIASGNASLKMKLMIRYNKKTRNQPKRI